MPFTFSHPAAVLPLTSRKLKLSATGLIIGSMAPDFEYFLRMTDRSRFSHTLTGAFWFDLPIAILLCFLYHLIVRNPLFDNLPPFLKERMIIYKKFQWDRYFSGHWIIVCFSILIGVFTHLLWDDITHETKFFVQKQPELSNLMHVGTVNLAGYNFLQFASSLFGGLIVIIAILTLKKHPYVHKEIDYKYWALVIIIFLCIMGMRFFAGLNIHDHRPVIVSMISGLIIALILTPILLSRQTTVESVAQEHAQES
jgi:hypothetical protein